MNKHLKTTCLALLTASIALTLTACSLAKRGGDAKHLEHPVKTALSFHEVYGDADYWKVITDKAAGLSLTTQTMDATNYGYIATADTARFMQAMRQPDVKQALPADCHVMTLCEGDESGYCAVYLVKQSPNLSLWNVTLNDIYIDSSEFDDRPFISLKLGERDAQQWANMTRVNIGHFIAMTLNGRLLTVPRVNTEITGGAVSILGNYTQEELQSMVNEITAGTE